MTSPYSPDTARSEAIGATSAGFDVAANGSIDDLVGLFNINDSQAQAEYLAVKARQRQADLRRRLRLLQGVAPTPLSILAVGDSIMRGYGSSDWAGWRGWLTDGLDQLDIAATITPCGDAGYTLAMVQPLVAAALTASNPAVVIVAIGTNDAVHNDLTNWQQRFADLLNQILAFSPTVKVLVVRTAQSAPFTGYQTLEATVGGYQDTDVAALAAGGRVAEIDAGAPLNPDNVNSAPYSQTYDGIHPTDALYAVLADAMLAKLVALGWLP